MDNCQNVQHTIKVVATPGLDNVTSALYFLELK